MPRDRKQYNKDMTEQKIAYRNAPKLFRAQKSLFHGKSIQQGPVLNTTPTEQISDSPADSD